MLLKIPCRLAGIYAFPHIGSEKQTTYVGARVHSFLYFFSPSSSLVNLRQFADDFRQEKTNQ